MNPYQSALASSAPSSNFPIGNESAKNNQQRAKGIVDQQSDALARVSEIRGLWAESSQSQQERPLGQSSQTTFTTGQVPSGEFESATQFSSSKTFKMPEPSIQAPSFSFDLSDVLNRQKSYLIEAKDAPSGAGSPPIPTGGMKTMWNTQTGSWEDAPAISNGQVFAGAYYDVDPKSKELKTEAWNYGQKANKNIETFAQTQGRYPTQAEAAEMNPLTGKLFGHRAFTSSTNKRSPGEFQLHEQSMGRNVNWT